MRQRSAIPNLLFLLMICVSASPLFSSNLYLPALPVIEAEFGVNRQLIASTLTIYMVSFSATTLFAGTILDLFGRRKPVIIGLIIFLLGSVLCGISSSFTMLMWGRALQGFGGAVLPIAMRAVLRDRLRDRPFIIKIGWMGIVIGLAPMFAPFLGSFIIEYFSWRANFYLIEWSGLFIGICALIFIKESQHYSHRLRFSLMSVLGSFYKVFFNKDLLSIVLPISICYVYSSFLVTLAPFALEDMHYPSNALGIFLCGYVCIAVAGRYFMIYLMNHFSESKIWLLGAVLILISGFFHVVYLIDIFPAIPVLLTAFGFFSLGTGMMNPLGNKGALSAVQGLGATSAGLLMFMIVIFQALGAWLCSHVLISSFSGVVILSYLGIISAIVIFLISLYSERHFVQD